jgi:HEXXH motif-containing protein
MLCEQFRQEVIDGMGAIADTMKALLYQQAPELFKCLDFERDDIFLEPLLFAYFNHADRDQCATLPQLLFGYLDKASRPACIPVVSADNGVVYLPQIGYFKTGVRHAQLDLVYENGVIRLEHAGEHVPHTFESRLLVADGKLEVYRYNHPLFIQDYVPYDPWLKDLPPVEVEVEDTVKRHLPSLEKALAILKRYCPPVYEEILATNRSVTLFHNPAVYCFVTLSIHGAIFLTTIPENDEVFFLEELIHQCSHNTFNAVLFDKEPYFTIDVEREMLGVHLNKRNETRTIYSALHGLYTVVKRYECFDVLYHEDIFSGRQKHEFLGRIGDIKKRLHTGLDGLDSDRVYTPKGVEMYRRMQRTGDDVAQRLSALDGVFDFSNQPYEFSYAKFAELNPLDRFREIEGRFPTSGTRQ